MAGLLAVHFALAVSSVRDKSPTYDESLHLTRGYTYWQARDFRLAPPHPPLAPLWAAMPIVAVPARLPDLDSQAWRQSDVYNIGGQFFYGMRNDLDGMLQRSRSMIAVMSVLLGLAVFAWSRQIFGLHGGLLSLVLYAFSPTMLAHSRLVTTDLMLAALYLFAVGAAWRAYHRLTPLTAACACLAMAGLFLAKLAAFFVIPILLALIAIRAVSRQPWRLSAGKRSAEISGRPRKALLLLLLLVGQLLAAYAGIWAGFGFRYDTFRYNVSGTERLPMPLHGSSGRDPWEVQYEDQPGLESVIEAGRRHKLLPEPYLYSIALGSQTARARYSFLNGNHSLTGFKLFFPYCFLYKTPLPLMAILACALLGAALTYRARGKAAEDGQRSAWRQSVIDGAYATAPLWLCLAVYWGVMTQASLNIGHRHLLPTYPVLFVLAGGAAHMLSLPGRAGRSLVAILVACSIGASLWVYPHYLSYFNLIAGGPSNGYRHLVDSSLDWGQDLRRLKTWLDENAGREEVFLAYFGNTPPAYYGVSAHEIPYESIAFGRPRTVGLPRLTAGIYCVSATCLQQVYTPALQEWTAEKEQTYWELLPQMREFEEIPLANRDALAREVARRGEHFRSEFTLFQRLRYAKLCAYLRTIEPDDRVAYSILVYRLDDEDIQTALYKGQPDTTTSSAAAGADS